MIRRLLRWFAGISPYTRVRPRWEDGSPRPTIQDAGRSLPEEWRRVRRTTLRRVK